MNMTLSELQKFKSVNQLAKEWGYSDSSYISRKTVKLKLGFDSQLLGLHWLQGKVRLLSPKDIATLKENLNRFKQKAEEF